MLLQSGHHVCPRQARLERVPLNIHGLGNDLANPGLELARDHRGRKRVDRLHACCRRKPLRDPGLDQRHLVRLRCALAALGFGGVLPELL